MTDAERFRPLSADEFGRLVGCKSEQEWNKACDAVKAARDGSYPSEWFARMNASGLMASIFAGFKEDA